MRLKSEDANRVAFTGALSGFIVELRIVESSYDFIVFTVRYSSSTDLCNTIGDSQPTISTPHPPFQCGILGILPPDKFLCQIIATILADDANSAS